MSSVSYITINDDFSGQRIDNFLMRQLKGVPRSLIYRVLRSGEVRVNKGRIKPAYKVVAGDEIRLPPIRVKQESTELTKLGSKKFDLCSRVLFEDNNFLIVDKPANLAVHGGSGQSFGLIELARDQFSMPKLELVHRLDKDTSGCLLLAKKHSSLRVAHQLWRDGLVRKQYHALVKGAIKKSFAVNQPLHKFSLKSGERMVEVADCGKQSLTKFSVIDKYRQATLLLAAPITGRTHQIRVHLAFNGTPIIGDPKYGDYNFNQQVKAAGYSGMFLHARSLSFDLPITGESITVQADYDHHQEFILDLMEGDKI